jgi:hypothetical protein
VSVDYAREAYGVVIDAETMEVDVVKKDEPQIHSIELKV